MNDAFNDVIRGLEQRDYEQLDLQYEIADSANLESKTGNMISATNRPRFVEQTNDNI